MDQGASKELNKHQCIQSNANAMVRIGQASLRAHGKPTEDQNNSDQSDGQDLKVDVESEGKARVAVVETRDEDG